MTPVGVGRLNVGDAVCITRYNAVEIKKPYSYAVITHVGKLHSTAHVVHGQIRIAPTDIWHLDASDRVFLLSEAELTDELRVEMMKTHMTL